MILPKAAKTLLDLWGKVPDSTQDSVLEALVAIIEGEPTKAERLARNAALERLQASKRLNSATYTQISLKALPGNSAAEQEQLFRRVRGWLSPQNTGS